MVVGLMSRPVKEKFEVIDIDVFYNDRFVSTERIQSNEAEKIKQDLETTWGYDKDNLVFYSYDEQEFLKHINMVADGYVEYVYAGFREIHDHHGNIYSTIRASKRY